MTKGQEIRDVPGFPGYSVSESGDVYTTKYRGERSTSPKQMKPWTAPSGYSYVHLLRGGKEHNIAVHRLVLLAFRGPPSEDQKHSRHLDGSKNNNHISNLAWGTVKENSDDSEAHGTKPRGESHGNALLTKENVLEIRRLRSSGVRTAEICERFNLSRGHVKNIVSGRAWAWLEEKRC